MTPIRADIFRWDNGELIPGTAGVTPVPGVDLQVWNTDSHNLQYADFSAGLDLSRANFRSSWLDYTHFQGANLTNAYLYQSTLTNANLSGATVKGANFDYTTTRGFTKEQLYSTASYQAKNLQGILLEGNNLSGWDFSGQNLSYASLDSSMLTNANLSGANLTGASLDSSTLTNANLGGAILSQAQLDSSTLTNANLGGANLSNANLDGSTLTNADLGGATVTGAEFGDTTSRGFTKEQLYSTASYQAKNLQGIGLGETDLSGWNFSGQNLTGAYLYNSTLTNANLTGAVVNGADFNRPRNGHGTGITEDQLYSTQSYQAKNLAGINFGYNSLSGWNLSEQNLANADFYVEVYHCASILRGANLTGADTRGSVGSCLNENGGGATTDHAIMPDGRIMGLSLALGDKLVVRNYHADAERELGPIPVTIQSEMMMGDGSVLQLVLESDPWDSLISFQPGIPVTLGGTLELTFTDDVNLASQVGRTLHIFDWTGVSPTGEFQVENPYAWDLSKLYTTGQVTLVGAFQAADFDEDGTVDSGDLTLWASGFGSQGRAAHMQGDADGDSDVDGFDFLTWQRQFGTVPGSTSASAIPEPAAAVLIVLGMLAVCGLGRYAR
jgi:uncharacterized protein YjbI with pentapeptide repeats